MTGGIPGFQSQARSSITVPTPASPHDRFVIGCDLGQSQDYTALCVLERITVNSSEVRQQGFEAPAVVNTTRKVYHLRHLQRLKLGTGYPEIVQFVGTLLKALPPAKMAPALVVDSTGVGRPVIDAMKKAGLRPIAVTITGGFEENQAHTDDWRVPKRNLVSMLAVLMQSGRLKVAPDLAEAETFVNELSNFRVKISAAGHDSYNAWRESVHDDLCLAVCLACWWVERNVQPAKFMHLNWIER
jgi:hypothetical protein